MTEVDKNRLLITFWQLSILTAETQLSGADFSFSQQANVNSMSKMKNKCTAIRFKTSTL